MFQYIAQADEKPWQPGPYDGVELKLLHKDEATGAVTVLSSTVVLSSGVNAVHGDDLGSDGVFDVLYVNAGDENAYYVCGLDATPFAAAFVSWGAVPTTTNYGLGFDPAANRLYGWDDDTRELITIE